MRTTLNSLIFLAAMLPVGAAAQVGKDGKDNFDCLIEARQQLDVRSSAEGVIEAVQVRRGDVVKKGDLLAKLSSGPELATLNLARSRAQMEGEIKAAAARVDLATKKYERADELNKRNFISASARDEAEAELRLATEQARALQESRTLAELEVKRAEEVLAQRSVRSPVNGVVVALLLHPGELTSSNQKDPILRLMEIDPLHVELILPVSQYGKIKRGQRARVEPEQPIGGSYTAQVDVVDRTIDAASGTFGVRLLLPNPGNRIPAGVKCRARF
jgi:RND family efflux transporter MFP subunit